MTNDEMVSEPMAFTIELRAYIRTNKAKRAAMRKSMQAAARHLVGLKCAGKGAKVVVYSHDFFDGMQDISA